MLERELDSRLDQYHRRKEPRTYSTLMDTKSGDVINSTLHQVMGREAASGTLVQVVGLEIRE